MLLHLSEIDAEDTKSVVSGVVTFNAGPLSCARGNGDPYHVIKVEDPSCWRSVTFHVHERLKGLCTIP